ncbi:MAG: DUF4920 domain-containing protein [Ferruginibacter sp.]
MKKILLMLPFFFLALAVNAQQTEDDVYVGKRRTFGNYRGMESSNTKPVAGQSVIIGTVIKVGWCEDDCLTILIKQPDGTSIMVGTKDYGFKVPKGIVGKKIIIEGISPAKRIVTKKGVKEYQRDIQFAASGVKLLD